MALLSSPWQSIIATPPATRLFVLLVLFLTGANYYLSWHALSPDLSKPPHVVPYITIMPGRSFYYPWTLVSAGFVEPSILELLVSLVFLTPCLRYLERLWGTFETIKFIVITLSLSNLIAFSLNWLQFFVLGNGALFLYTMDYHGQMALQAGVLVAFTQLIPEHQVQFFGSVSIRVKQLPMIYLTFSTVFTIIWAQSPFILIQFGWFVSWVYLRFYKRNTDIALGGADSYGDRSETFALVSWFPPIVHYPISALANTTYAVALKLHLVRPFPSASDVELGAYAAQPGGARAEAERRRAMALKALDQRVSATASMPASPANAAASTSAPTNVPTPSMPRAPPTAASASAPQAPVDGPSARAVEAAAARKSREMEGKGKAAAGT